MPEPGPAYLAPTSFLDFDRPSVRRFAQEAAEGAGSPIETAVRLYYAVRDGIPYDPFAARMVPSNFRASSVVKAGRGFCVHKAGLLAAMARYHGIPAAIGLSDVVDHLLRPKLRQAMGKSNVFLHHGYAALFLEGRWLDWRRHSTGNCASAWACRRPNSTAATTRCCSSSTVRGRDTCRI